MNYDQNLMRQAYDALAIYNYTRLPRHLYTEKECDMFAESVERIVNREKSTNITIADAAKPTYIQCAWEKAAKAGPENYKQVLSRGQGWRRKELAESMLQAYTSMPKGKEKEEFTKNLAISEAVLLDAMDNFELMLEGVSGSKEAIPDNVNKQTEKEKAEIQEKIKAANKEKRDKIKKRIGKAIGTAAIVGGVAAAAYAYDKKDREGDQQIQSEWKREVRSIQRNFNRWEKEWFSIKRVVEKNPDHKQKYEKAISIVDEMRHKFTELLDQLNREIMKLEGQYKGKLNRAEQKEFNAKANRAISEFTRDGRRCTSAMDKNLSTLAKAEGISATVNATRELKINFKFSLD